MSFSATDHAHMALALRLARRGLYSATPNPRVGCVLAHDTVAVGVGWHERAGGPHAEAVALAQAGDSARGATAYVTLEPCAHTGRTPPCADALVAAGVTRVVAAMIDPNPLVAGQGLLKLRAAGVAADSGLLAEAAQELNHGFVSRMTRGRPWLRLKAAISLDGKTALQNGVSQWITGADARRDAHRFRARACALLTGSGTVRADDPALTVREVATPRQPLRVVVDSRLSIPAAARVLAGGATLIYTAAAATTAAMSALRAGGAEIVTLADAQGQVDLAAMLEDLARRGINEVQAEAGARLNAALLAAGGVDELLIYQAPMLLGERACGLALLPELADLSANTALEIFETRRVGCDLRIRARLREKRPLPGG